MIEIHERVRRYLARMEPALSGSFGPRATFKVAEALIKDLKLSEEKACAFLMEWNAQASTPWSEKELRQFCRDAANNSTSPTGYPLTRGERRKPVDEAAERWRERQMWPSMRPLTPALMQLIASVRGVSVEAVQRIACSESIWRGRLEGQDCYIFREGPAGTFALARRLDGELLEYEGRKLKELILPGSEGEFLNPGGLGDPGAPVLLIEGVPVILQAAEFLRRLDYMKSQPRLVAFLAATSASSRFTPEMLEQLRGRKVVILADPNEAEEDAAIAWKGQLQAVGCQVCIILLPGDAEDFEWLLKTFPASDPFWRESPNFDSTFV